MIILALIKALPSSSDREALFEVFSKGLSVPEGVKVQGIYQLFGQYDMAILYEATDPASAAKYLSRELGPFAYIERSLAIPIGQVLE